MPRWLLWTTTALVSWGLWAVLSKLIGNDLSASHSQALSALGFLPVLAALCLVPGSPVKGEPMRGLGYAIAAGVVTSLGNLAYYAALQRGERAVTVIPLTALYPVFTIALAVPLLREKLSLAQKIGVALSLGATYLFNVQRETGLLSSALVHALPPILLWGLSGFFQKLATNHLSSERCALAFLAAALPVSVVILAREPLAYAQVSLRTWGLVVALGLFFALGNFAILAAFARGGKASLVAPLGGLYPILSIPIAIVWLGENVSPRELAGIALALASVVALALEPTPPTSPFPANPVSTVPKS